MMRFFLTLFLFLLIGGIANAEIVAVSVHTAEIRSSLSPSHSYVVLDAPRFYPLSLRGQENGYFKVKDFEGRSGWIKKSLVDSTKAVVVDVNQANVRSGPGPSFPVVFKAYRGVAFKVVGSKDEWLEVRHENGQSGWIFKSLTWGQ
jgi:SH3-like domain-containing protein